MVVMRDANKFFQGKTQECTILAYAADNETDREFWRRLARRWEEMQRPQPLKATEPLRRKNSLGRFAKWHISARNEPAHRGK